MSLLSLTSSRPVRVLVLVLGLPAGALHGQWTVAVRAAQHPLPPGQCTAIDVVVAGPGGAAPVRPDGRQVSGWDFDLELADAAAGAFAWQDERHRILCALAPTAPAVRVMATYPARHLGPAEVVPNVVLRQTADLFMAGAGQPLASAGPVSPDGAQGYTPGYPAPQPAYPGQGSAAPQGNYPVQGSYPTQSYPSASGYPPQGAYAQPGGVPDPGYAAPGYPAPGGYPQPAQPLPAPPPPQPPPDTARVRNGKQFFQRITGFAKRKASEVAANTTTQVADATGDVIGSTLETGSQVVKSGTGAVTGAAGEQVQGLGRTLGARQDARDPEDIAAALAAGRAVLRGLRFTEGTAILEASSGPIVSQLAGALARTPGQFLIEAHVDGQQSPAAQALSEQRAAAVKAALVAAGSSPMQLAAVGYGASRPVPGAARSARIEIARTQ